MAILTIWVCLNESTQSQSPLLPVATICNSVDAIWQVSHPGRSRRYLLDYWCMHDSLILSEVTTQTTFPWTGPMAPSDAPFTRSSVELALIILLTDRERPDWTPWGDDARVAVRGQPCGVRSGASSKSNPLIKALDGSRQGHEAHPPFASRSAVACRLGINVLAGAAWSPRGRRRPRRAAAALRGGRSVKRARGRRRRRGYSGACAGRGERRAKN